jgi:hypothetical protein
MNITRPELKLERMLAALEQELLETSDDEILSVATEIGLRPGMQGSVALAGVLMTVHLRRGNREARADAGNKTARRGIARTRRGPKDDTPGS